MYHNGIHNTYVTSRWDVDAKRKASDDVVVYMHHNGMHTT